MATAAQIEANRLNAQQSTGPRTPQGKAISSRNATKLGLFSRQLLQPGEDPADLEALHDDMMAEYRPETTLERLYADRIVTAAWRLQRALGAEGRDEEIDYDPARTLAPISTAFTVEVARIRSSILDRRICTLERSMDRATTHLLRLQKIRRDLEREYEKQNDENEPDGSNPYGENEPCIVADTPDIDDIEPLNTTIHKTNPICRPDRPRTPPGRAPAGSRTTAGWPRMTGAAPIRRRVRDVER